MKVEFLHDWQGSRVGDILEMQDGFVAANDMIARKIVKPVKPKADEENIRLLKKNAQQRAELARLKKKLKNVDAAPKNKMVVEPEVKK